MNAVASNVLQPMPKRSCYKCGRRFPVESLKARRTPAGGKIYTCTCCSKPKTSRSAQP